MHQRLERVGTGRLGRAAKLSRLALSGGKKMLMDRARGALGGSGPSEQERGVGLAAEMLRTFSELRGVSMKLGQMLSYLDDALPPEARKVLSVLQRDVAPVSWKTAQTVLTEDLGRPPERVFEDFEETPIAAASIGQVHRATLPGGQEVAVKIQYPGMGEAMRSDLKNARVLGVMQRMLGFGTDPEALMRELEQRFVDECDYTKEARYQDAYSKRFAHHPVIVVPRVHIDLSSEHVLVTDFHRGRGYYEWLASKPSEAERQRAVRSFYRFYLGSFYMDGLFNCDPHPGNYLFQDDGTIAFLDYGCCRTFRRERIALWIELCRVLDADDVEGLERVGTKLGFLRGPNTYDRKAFRELMRYLYRPYIQNVPFRFAEYRPRDTFRQMFIENANLFKLNMPAEAVFLNRISFGLLSLMGDMGGVMNLHAYLESYFKGQDPDWSTDPFQGFPFSVESPG